MTTEIEDGCAHVDCCAELNDGVNRNSCVGANDSNFVNIGAIIGECLVDNMRTSRVSFHLSSTIPF